MGEYVDKDKLREAIYNVGGENFYTLGVLSLLRDFPTADVAPVRHGHWGTDKHGFDRAVCSECGAVYDSGPHIFCPRCGAKMDGEGDNNG